MVIFLFWCFGFFLLAQNPINNSQISTMQGVFSKASVNTQSSDSISGKFYFYNGGKIFFKVDFPLNQIMIIEKNMTYIYYPESLEGFELESTNPVALPLVTGILAAIREDYGLSLMGFKMFDQKINNDSLITYWSYPPAPEKAGKFIITNFRDKLYSVEYQAPDSVSNVITFFKEYINIDDMLLPTLIESKAESPTGFTDEKVILSGMKVNSAIPAEIIEFKIPDSVELQKRKW